MYFFCVFVNGLRHRLWVALLLGSLLLFSNGVAANGTLSILQQGEHFYQSGDFASAIERFQMALEKMQPGSRQHFNTLIRLAVAYQKVGNSYTTAYEIFQRALWFAEQSGIPARQVLVHSYLGDLLLVMQQSFTAIAKMDEQLDLARTLGDSPILAHFLTNFANVLSVEQEYAEALAVYQEVAEMAARLDESRLQVQALRNQAQVHINLKLDNVAESTALLEKALSLLLPLPDSYDKAFSMLSLGELVLRIQSEKSNLTDLQELSGLVPSRIFRQVLRLAAQYQNKRLISQAKGLLGQVYQREQRYSEALQLTREAIFFAQEFPELLYFWELRQGQILQAQQNLADALAAYRRALAYLQPIRTELNQGQRNTQAFFYERIQPVYYGLADVLLQQAAITKVPSQKAQWLSQAREAVEQLKMAELQNYFQDECVSAQQTSIKSLDEQLAQQKNTAIFYPIILPERIELLLSLHDGIHQTVIHKEYDTLRQTVLTFRRNVQNTVKGSFITQAKSLYQWLITPIREQLAAYQINTLVIVPDGFLRMIPMAALYDAQEKRFLFQQFALASTPGLTLTDPRRLPRKNIQVLLNGLSEGVQGFPPLPSVIQEIQQINSVFNNSTVLLDQTFTLDGFSQTVQSAPYEIVHISTHGQFDRNPKQSFLLTYDDKLTMEQLEKLFQLSESRKKKVELLTLSACQTAVGDEQAALGLAGVAIKAGARSALASLWFVDDEATSQLISEFYQQLQNSALSKAQALQNAQNQLAKQRQFRHPAYWAPFLLIGNWL